MLVITRKPGEAILLETAAGQIEVRLLAPPSNGQVKLGITAPHEVLISREEITTSGDRVHLPALLSTSFGISRTEARQLIVSGGVRIDDERILDTDVSASVLTGTLRAGAHKYVKVNAGVLVSEDES